MKKRAQSVLGMVKRHFKELDKEDFFIIYNTYIRPCTLGVLCASMLSTLGEG